VLIESGLAGRLISYVNRRGGPLGESPSLANSDFYAVQRRDVEDPHREPETYAVVVYRDSDGFTHELLRAQTGKGFPHSIDAPLTVVEFTALSRAARLGEEARKSSSDSAGR